MKPADLDGGVGVAAGLMNADEVRAAFVAAKSHSKRILIEKHVAGRDYRISVFQGQVLWAIERQPAGVTGDGLHTIRQLLDTANADPLRGAGAHAAMKMLELDDEALSMLLAAGLNEASVPAAGSFVPLRRKANIAAGGTPIAVFDEVHPDNAVLAIRAAEALRLDLAGIDLLIPDIRKSWKETGAAVCEVNAQPQLGGVTSRHVYSEVLKALLHGNGRIPIAVVLGAAVVERLVTMVAAKARKAGYVLGYATPNAVWVGEQMVLRSRVDGYRAGQILLTDKNVEAVVLCINDAHLLLSGLPFDRIDLLVLAGARVDPSATDKVARVSDNPLIELVKQFLLPACTGKVLLAPESGLEIKAAMPQGKWVLEKIPQNNLADCIAKELQLLLEESK